MGSTPSRAQSLGPLPAGRAGLCLGAWLAGGRLDASDLRRARAASESDDSPPIRRVYRADVAGCLWPAQLQSTRASGCEGIPECAAECPGTIRLSADLRI